MNSQPLPKQQLEPGPLPSSWICGCTFKQQSSSLGRVHPEAIVRMLKCTGFNVTLIPRFWMLLTQPPLPFENPCTACQAVPILKSLCEEPSHTAAHKVAPREGPGPGGFPTPTPGRKKAKLLFSTCLMATPPTGQGYGFKSSWEAL